MNPFKFTLVKDRRLQNIYVDCVLHIQTFDDPNDPIFTTFQKEIANFKKQSDFPPKQQAYVLKKIKRALAAKIKRLKRGQKNIF